MAALETFRQRLADGEVVVIDGGMGSELKRRGVPMHRTAWAAPAVLDHYDIVRETHEDYIRAGATVVIANSFMASHHALRDAGMLDRLEEINRLSVRAALDARQNSGQKEVLVAAPMFGGEPDDQDEVLDEARAKDADQLDAELREQAQIVADAGADLIALEMIQTTDWGVAATKAAAAVGLPVWLGVSQGRMEFEDGEDFVMPFDPPGHVGEQVRLILERAPEADVMAVNVMHTMLDEVPSALDEVDGAWSGTVGVYPHHGHLNQADHDFVPEHIDPSAYLDHARRWVARGVQIVGGCCGIGPEHVKALADGLPRRVS